ncbi:MAG TPA: non-canonical purine NTP pyrophosphatase [Iamia sp.]|nr:non-canonical purine NTP pyrophosphatase [Iamia sp.]
MARLVVVAATANPAKLPEIAAILGEAIELRPRPTDVPDVEEDAPDLVGNARLKAVALAEATGLPALSDDTGLEVDALDGRPGVRSARYAGEDGDAVANVAKLLGELAAVPEEARTARFRTVVMVRWPDGREVAAEGVVEGVIAPAPRGGGGFGYDPVFLADEGGGLSFAEMDADVKDAISHRGRALRAVATLLASI